MGSDMSKPIFGADQLARWFLNKVVGDARNRVVTEKSISPDQADSRDFSAIALVHPTFEKVYCGQIGHITTFQSI